MASAYPDSSDSAAEGCKEKAYMMEDVQRLKSQFVEVKKLVEKSRDNSSAKAVAEFRGNSSVKETVSFKTSPNQNRASDAQNVPGTTGTWGTRKYITYEEALKNLSESSERHISDGYFMDRSDP